MARPFHAPDFLPLFPGAVRDPLDALEDPDEEDAGELPEGRYFDVIRRRGLDAASDEEDEADSGYGSLSEEDVSEEEDKDTEGEEEDEDTESEEEDTESEEEDTESEEEDQRLPPEACPRGTPLLQLWRFLSRGGPRPASPPPAPCPVIEEERCPGGSRRHRDEDEEEEPISKRPRVSYSEDIEEEPTPSTSAGTSGGFVHYAQPPHLLQDSDSD